MARKPKPKPKPERPDKAKAVAQIVVAIIDGEPPPELVAIATRHRVPLDDADGVVELARDVLRKAADVDRAGELGLTLRRLDDLYNRATAGDADEEALALGLRVQTERNRVLRLHEATVDPLGDGDENAAGSESAAELARIRAHLLPTLGILKLPDDYPLDEIARVLAKLAADAP